MKLQRVWILGLLLLVFFLRVFDFAHVQFDADFGRDSLFAYRILHDKPTLLGAQASVGGFYLGPLYFYAVALLFSVFGPVPEIIMLSFTLTNVLAAWLGWKVLSSGADRKAGIIFLTLFAVSAPLILASRGATHMPMLPAITILVVLLLFRALKSGKHLDHFISGLALGLFLHVHFSALLLFPGYFVVVFLLSGGKLKEKLAKIAIGTLALVIMTSPLICFDIRHGFITSKAFFSYISSSALGGEIRTGFPHWTVGEKLLGVSGFISPSGGWGLVMVIASTIGLLKLKKAKSSEKLLFQAIVGLSVSATGLLILYHGYLFKYYLIVPGTLCLILMAYLLSKWGRLGLILTLVAALSSFGTVVKIYVPSERTIPNLTRVTGVIEQRQTEQGNPLFEIFKDSADNMTGLAYEYRFLLTRDGHVPVSEYDYSAAKVLYVIREDGESDPLTLGNYEVKQFSPKSMIWKSGVNWERKKIEVFELTH